MHTKKISEYNPAWPEHFAQEATRLRSIFQDTAKCIVHIGSTAIPNVPAKPIIDILVGTHGMEIDSAYAQTLQNIGYRPQENSIIWQKEDPHTQHGYQLYLCDVERPEALACMRFVQYMHSNPDAAQHYARLKKRYAKKIWFSNKRYTNMKRSFFENSRSDILDWINHHTLQTKRLILRPFTPEDAPIIHQYAGSKDIAENVSQIPYPLPIEVIESWIPSHRKRCERGEQAVFAITLPDTGELIGATSLTIDREKMDAELGYWIGKPFWNNGYCTESSTEMLRHGFEDLYLRRIYARCFHWNHASAKIMQKVNMHFVESQDEYVEKWDRDEAIDLYEILYDQYKHSKLAEF